MLRLARALSLVLALCACDKRDRPRPPPAEGASGTADPNAKLAADVDAFVSGFGATWGPAHAARGIVAIARDGTPVFWHAYGIPATLDTRFAIGSVTKTLTAAAVLRLVDEGRLALADPVRRILPELKAPGTERLTIEHLLTHASGIPSYTEDAELMRARDTPRTTASILARIVARPLAFTPGARFAYSNSNYYLLGLVLERIVREPYEAAMRHLVLDRAGMTRTALEGELLHEDAHGETVDDDDRLAPARPAHPGLSFAASGLRSSAHDLFAFDRALGGALLSDASILQMETPRKGAYACGWECWREVGEPIVSHEGGIDGFSAFFGRAPHARVSVVVLLATDAFSGDRLAAGTIGEPVLAMALGAHPPAPPVETPVVPLDEARARAITGDWTLARVTPGTAEPARAREVPAPARLGIALEGDRLFISPTGEPRVRLFQAADGAFFPKQVGVRLTATSDGELSLVRFGREMVYRRGDSRPAISPSDRDARAN